MKRFTTYFLAGFFCISTLSACNFGSETSASTVQNTESDVIETSKYTNSDFLDIFVDDTERDLLKRFNNLSEKMDSTEYKRIGILLNYMKKYGVGTTEYDRKFGILSGYILTLYSDLEIKSDSTETLKEFKKLWNNPDIYSVDNNAKLETIYNKISRLQKEKKGDRISSEELIAYRVPTDVIRYYMIVQYLINKKELGEIAGNYETLQDLAVAYMKYSGYLHTIEEYNLNVKTN